MIDDSITYFKNDLTYMAIPYALVENASNVLYNTYIILENQLSQIKENDDIYKNMNLVDQRVFDSWVMLGCREGEEYGV